MEYKSGTTEALSSAVFSFKKSVRELFFSTTIMTFLLQLPSSNLSKWLMKDRDLIIKTSNLLAFIPRDLESS